jgi:hypothetical protein
MGSTVMVDPRQKAAARYVGAVDEAELTCRLIEAAAQMKRPEGATARVVLEHTDPETVAAFGRAARAAMLYWAECFSNMKSVN